MDFLDFLNEINQKIDIYPIGINNQKASYQEIDMWSRWIEEIGDNRFKIVKL